MQGLCIRDLAQVTRGQLVLGDMPPLGGELEPVVRIVSDSRQINPGDIFWGLVGRFHNGSEFAEEAFARGAAGVVVAGRHVEPWAGKFSLQVEDANWALWQLARLMRRRFCGRVIAIAGNTGRTVLREMMHTVLHRSLTGMACQIDPIEKTALPFAMLSLEAEHDYAIFEMPLGSQGEIQSQSHLCDPRIGVITSHTNSKSANWMTSDELSTGQRELLAALPRDGWAVIPSDDESQRSRWAKLKAEVISTGWGSRNDVTAQGIAHRNGALTFSIDEVRFRVPNTTRNDLQAALATYAVGRIMELSPMEIATGLASYSGVKDHCHVRVSANGYTVVSDIDNTNITATLTALEFIRDLSATGRRIVVCGNLEVETTDAAEIEKNFGEALVASCGVDWVFATGAQAAEIVQAARRAGLPHGRAVQCESVTEINRILIDFLEPEDVVLVKGQPCPAWRQLIANLCGDQKIQTKAA